METVAGYDVLYIHFHIVFFFSPSMDLVLHNPAEAATCDSTNTLKLILNILVSFLAESATSAILTLHPSVFMYSNVLSASSVKLEEQMDLADPMVLLSTLSPH